MRPEQIKKESKSVSMVILLIVTLIAIMVGYNNCGMKGFRAPGAGDASSSGAECLSSSGLLGKYSSTFHQVFVAQCASCHNGQQVAIGDGRAAVSLEKFLPIPQSSVETHAGNNHCGADCNAALQSQMVSFYGQISSELNNYKACISGSGGGGDVGDPIEGPRVTSTSVAINAPVNGNVVNLNFDMASAVPARAGVTVRASVNMILINGVGGGYSIGNIRMVNTSGTALRVRQIKAKLNGNPISGSTTWDNVDIIVPNGTTADMVIGPGATQGLGSVAASDTLSFDFGEINPAQLVVANTFATLTAANGVFGRQCLSCHNAGNAGGNLNLTIYAQAASRLTAGNAAASLIYQRMQRTDAQRMPPAANVPANDLATVQAWINAGAPQ